MKYFFKLIYNIFPSIGTLYVGYVGNGLLKHERLFDDLQ